MRLNCHHAGSYHPYAQPVAPAVLHVRVLLLLHIQLSFFKGLTGLVVTEFKISIFWQKLILTIKYRSSLAKLEFQ